MNLENIKKLIEFKNDYDYVISMQWKFNTIKYYRNIIVFLAADRVEANIDAVVNEVRKMGYELKNIKDYNNLSNALTEVLITINKQVNDYLLKKTLDKALEKNIKIMFDIN